ncbi:MAG: putative molybdenum carrier protein [Planctomycetaceae bacterium]
MRRKAPAGGKRSQSRLPLVKVISGGQTGVDRAALDAALLAGLTISGWCPRGRRAEDGPISSRYALHETPSPGYAERTRWNVRDADATLVLTAGPPTGGTSLTCAAARIQQRPYLVIDSRVTATDDAIDMIRTWIEHVGIQVLNIAGPRESTSPGMYDWARSVLTQLFVSHSS